MGTTLPYPETMMLRILWRSFWGTLREKRKLPSFICLMTALLTSACFRPEVICSVAHWGI